MALKTQHADIVQDLDNKKKRIEEIEVSKEELEKKLQEGTRNLASKVESIDQIRKDITKENKKYMQEIKNKEDLKKMIQAEENRVKACSKEIEKLKLANTQLTTQLEELEEEFKFEARNITTIDRENIKFTNELNSTRNLILDLQNQITVSRKEVEDLNNQVNTAEIEKEKMEKDLENAETHQEDEFKNKNRMEQIIKEHKNKLYKVDLECHQLESRAKKLENQNKGYEIESIKLNNQIRDLQKQQAKYGAEASTAHARFYQTVEELKIKNSIIDELQKKNVDLENKLKHQQNLYEAVRSDRNLYSKNLLEAQEETFTLMKKFMMMSHQITQLKEEIKRKDEQFLKESIAFDNAEKQRKATEAKGTVITAKIKSQVEFIKHHENQIAKLKYIIGEAQAERQKQMKDHEMVLNERDILGAQLIKRNQELEVLYEKIKISQSNLEKGEKHFRDKQSELAELKSKLISLRQEYADSEDAVANVGQFKTEINSLEKEILKEKTKNRALEDELQYPMNVHRWKKMEATDPDNYERIMKIQTLQRRVITKTEEVEEKDKLIKDKEQLFLQLKNILARQPGYEVRSQVDIYRESLKDKTGQLKKMLIELKDTQSKVKAHKYEIGMVNDQIGNIKQEYFKKREVEEKAKFKELQQSLVPKSTINKQAYYESLGIQPALALGVGNNTGNMN